MASKTISSTIKCNQSIKGAAALVLPNMSVGASVDTHATTNSVLKVLVFGAPFAEIFA